MSIAQVKVWMRRLSTVVLAVAVAACGGGGGNAGTPIVGGGGTSPSSFADLSVQLNKTSISNNGNESVEVTVTSLDANRSTVGSVPITFAIDNGGVISPADKKTDSAGVLKAVATMGGDRTNRTIKITVASGSVAKIATFDVVDSVSGGKVADLAMTLNRTSLPNDGTVAMQITTTTLDASRSALGGSPVSFKVVDTGDAFVSTAGATTTDNSTGQIIATVSLGTVHTNRTIKVTATSGTVSRTVSFDVVDPLVTAPHAADMTMQLSGIELKNSGSEAITVTITAVDTLRNVIPNIPVSFTANNNATVTVLNSLTDAKGQAKAEIRIGSDQSERLITVTAKSESLTRTGSFNVTGVSIQGTALPTLPSPGTAARIVYSVVDTNKNAMIGVPITVVPSVVAPSDATGPIEKSGVTDIHGSFTYFYTAPATPGPIEFTVSAAGKTTKQTVTIPSSGTTVPVASPVPSQPTLTLTPNVVRVNVGTSTDNRAEIRALFLAPTTNAPVKNVRVRFDLNGDVNSIGGKIGSGDEIVYSDAGGSAVTSYTAGDRASPTNGVSVRACWDVNNFELGTCPNFTTINFTVVSDPLAISIGTDATISKGPSGLTYIKKFVVLVVDAAGNPKSDIQLTPSVDLLYSRKGYYQFVGTTWIPKHWERPAVGGTLTKDVPDYGPSCANEDLNRNGAIDGAEDLNGNGQLDPRKSDIAISMVGGTKTDSSGTAVLQIEYPQSLADWVYMRISVAAAGVLSPPAITDRWADIDFATLKNETPPPPFRDSPYKFTQYLDGSSCKVFD